MLNSSRLLLRTEAQPELLLHCIAAPSQKPFTFFLPFALTHPLLYVVAIQQVEKRPLERMHAPPSAGTSTAATAAFTASWRGLPHLTSPSLPSAVQRELRRQNDAVAECAVDSSAAPLHDRRAMASTPEQQVASYDLSDPTFSDTLSRLGPSARKLLALAQEVEAEESGGAKQRARTAVANVKSSTLPAMKSNKGTAAGTLGKDYGVSEDNGTISSQRRAPALRHGERFAATMPERVGQGERASLPPKRGLREGTSSTTREEAGSARLLRSSSPALNGTVTSLNSTMGARQGQLQSTITRRHPCEEPPLVQTLRRFLDKEVLLATGGAAAPVVALEQLGPYREAFAAFITAVPGYAAFLSDIRAAFDNVIQRQAELLAESYAKEMTKGQELAKHREDVRALQQNMSRLHHELDHHRQQLLEREAALSVALEKEAEHIRLEKRNGRSGEVVKQLEMAQQRVEELSRINQSDLEKILVLIGAVRECDRRMVEYEQKVRFLSGQVEELDEFKRLAGEAQTQLQRYKERFEAFVPSDDFDVMKAFLTDELEVAHAAARRMRRTAAVRGTQVDVLNRRVLQLEAEQRELLDSGNPTGQLTPRPNWAQVQRTLPELADHVKPTHSAPLEVEQGEEWGSGTTGVEVLTVAGPTKTVEQVNYLVEQVYTLQQRLAAKEAQCKSTEEELRQLQATRPPGSTTDVLFAHPSAKAMAASTTRGTQLSVSAVQSLGSQGNPSAHRSRGSSSSLTLHGAGLPIVGPGMGDNVPVHLRACGVVERHPVEPVTAVQLCYDFFLNVLKPAVDGLDEKDCNVPELLASFLEAERQESGNAALAPYRCAAHLALNLAEDARDPLLCTFPLMLLLNVSRGTMPVRVAVDAVTVVAHVKADLVALAEEQKKPRLRRQAVSECICPILELKPAEQIAELRAVLGTDGTLDVQTLVGLEGRFIQTLFRQECLDSMEMYLRFLHAVTIRSQAANAGSGETDSAEEAPTSDAAFASVAPGDSVIALTDVAAAVVEVEPLTPAVVVRELTENAVGTKEVPVDEVEGVGVRPVHVRLSELIKAMGVAPLIRRTAQSSREECSL